MELERNLATVDLQKDELKAQVKRQGKEIAFLRSYIESVEGMPIQSVEAIPAKSKAVENVA